MGGFMTLDDDGVTHVEESQLLGRDEQHEQDMLHDFLLGNNNLGTFLSPKHGQLTRAEAQAAEAAAQAAAAAKIEKAAREAHQARRAAAAAAKEKERSERLKTSTDAAYRTQAATLLANMVAGTALPGITPKPNAAKEKEIRDRDHRHARDKSLGNASGLHFETSVTGGSSSSAIPSPLYSPESIGRKGGGNFLFSHHSRGTSGTFALPPATIAGVASAVPGNATGSEKTLFTTAAAGGGGGAGAGGATGGHHPRTPSISDDGTGVMGMMGGGGGTRGASPAHSSQNSVGGGDGGGMFQHPNASADSRKSMANGAVANGGGGLKTPLDAKARASRRRSRGVSTELEVSPTNGGGLGGMGFTGPDGGGGGSADFTGMKNGPGSPGWNKAGYGGSFDAGAGIGMSGMHSGRNTPSAHSPRAASPLYSPGTPGEPADSSPEPATVLPDGPGTVRICIKQFGQVVGLCGFMSTPAGAAVALQYQSSALVHVPDTTVLAIPRSAIEALLSTSAPNAPKIRAHLTSELLKAIVAAPWLKSLSPPHQCLLSSLFNHGLIPSGTTLFSSGECTVDSSPIYLLLEGRMEVTLTDERGRVARKKIEAGRFVGELAPVVGLCRTGTVATLTRCVVRVIQRRWLTLFYRTASHIALAQLACQALLKEFSVRDEQLLEQMDVQSAFGLFCLKEFSAENIEFWQTAVRFRKVIAPAIIRLPGAPAGSAETGPLPPGIGQHDGGYGGGALTAFSRQDVLTEAALLYTRYISERSLVQINLKEGVRASVLSAMRAGHLRCDSFLRAEAEIIHLMLHDNWSRFKSSKGFALACADLEPPEPQAVLLLPRDCSDVVRATAVASDRPWLHAAAMAEALEKAAATAATAAANATPGASPAPSTVPSPTNANGSAGGSSPMLPQNPFTAANNAAAALSSSSSSSAASAGAAAVASISVDFRWGAPVGRHMGELLFTPDGEVRCADNDPPLLPTAIVVSGPVQQAAMLHAPVAQGGSGTLGLGLGLGGGKSLRMPSLPVVIDSPMVGATGMPSIILQTPQGTTTIRVSGGSGGGGDGSKGGEGNWLLQGPSESIMGGGGGAIGEGGERLHKSETPERPSGEDGEDTLAGLAGENAAEGAAGGRGGGGGTQRAGDISTRSPQLSQRTARGADGLLAPVSPLPVDASGQSLPRATTPGSADAGANRRATLDRPPARAPAMGGRTHSHGPVMSRRASSRHAMSPFAAIGAHNAAIAEAVFRESIAHAVHQPLGIAHAVAPVAAAPPSPHSRALLAPTGASSDREGNPLSPESVDSTSPLPSVGSTAASVERRGVDRRSTMASLGMTIKRSHGVHQKLKASPFNVPQARRK